jgi:hypothetical protein
MKKIITVVVLVFLIVPTAFAITPRVVSSPFTYNFSSNGMLDEVGSMSETSSPYFWLNSGGKFIIDGGIGKTIQNALPVGNFWQLAYALSSGVDTDHGLYPQNLFRLLTSSTWNNFTQEVSFKITKIHMTETPNRDGYSGILLFNRYKDSDNLYYTGIRMDGTAVIKKKLKGVYYTLATGNVFSSETAYDKDTNPNLIPGNRWIRLKSEVHDLSSGEVSVALFIDKTNSGTWTPVLSTVDKTGQTSGTAVISGAGYAGIRTDYMDVIFDDYKLTTI